MNIHIPTVDELIQVVKSQNHEEERVIIAEIMRIFQTRNLTAQRQLIEQCPSFQVKEQLLSVIDLNNQASHINTLGLMAISYSLTSSPELSVVFGKAGYFLGKDNYCKNSESSLSQEILCTSLTQSVLGCATALYYLGQYEELLKFSEIAFLWLVKEEESLLKISTDDSSKAMVRDNINSLKLLLIETNIKIQKYPEDENLMINIAEDHKIIITEDQLRLSDRYRFKRLKSLRDKLAAGAQCLPLEQERGSQTFDKVFDDASEQLNEVVNLAKYHISQFDQQKERSFCIINEITYIQTFIEQQKSEMSFKSELTLSQRTGTAAIEISNLMANLMATLGFLSEIDQIKQKIRTACSIFLDPDKERDPILLQYSLETLQYVQRWTKARSYLEEECEALWGISICYRRQESNELDANLKPKYTEKSVESLQALRENIELIRSRIEDPYKRGHWINRYEYLFQILCWQLYRLDRPLELLEAIEGAKGRVLADVLTKKEGKPVPDFDFSTSVRQLPTLMKQFGAHYLTYLVDDDETFAVLIAKDGSFHIHAIEVGKTQLKELLSHKEQSYDPLDPRNWGRQKPSRGSKKSVPNLSECLAPFVSWLESYAENGLIQKNDHICYSPDESLHLIPLHYLPFLGKPLIYHCSVSRIHGAAALVELLKQPSQRPSQLTAVYVPAQSDLSNPKNSAQKIEDMRSTAYWLKESKNMTGRILSEKSADVSTVTKLPFSHSLVHFSTHGIFPSEYDQTMEYDQNTDKNINPYNSSGLVLAINGELPQDDQGDQDDQREKCTLLTPKVIIDENLDFSGSHVTLQACVSGKAREGIGGDAIGLDWALMLANASSILSTHWNVDVSGARLFSEKFYQYWLFENQNSRAQAWQKTVLDLLESQETCTPYYWAAFSLSGDWR